MRRPSDPVDPSDTHASGRLLLIVAAESEARAVLSALGHDGPPPAQWSFRPVSGRADLLLTGVGKANAAGATAHALSSSGPRTYQAAINLGIAGALPSLDGPRDTPPGAALAFTLPLNAAILASTSTFADEGLESPGGGFQSLAEMGFPMIGEPVVSPGAAGPAIGGDSALGASLMPLVDLAAPIATVSTCSGTNALALQVARRTGALAEGMEGAAIALACHRLGVPFAEVRVISNTTGDRAAQVWKVREALARVGGLGAGILAALGAR